MKRTYQLLKSTPPAMEWPEYEALIRKEWGALLGKSPPPDEREVQRFLEKHPCLIPGALGFRGGPSGHCPHYGTVITQAVLPSYDKKVPDFMWLANDSEVDQPVLIEIESPGKSWWIGSGQQSAELTQALDQIVEWKGWFEKPQNQIAFKDYYGLDQHPFFKRPLQPEYILIYGRRAEANRTPELMEKRHNLRDPDIVMMTYDRLAPDANVRELLCAKKSLKEFEAVTVPPTTRLGPTFAHNWMHIKGKGAAALSSPYLSSERKAFLASRWDYWDNWAASDPKGITWSADHE